MAKSSSDSGTAVLLWVLGGVLCVVLLGCCGVGVVGYIIVNSVTKAVGDVQKEVSAEMPGAAPKDVNEALAWIDKGGNKRNNAFDWLQRRTPDEANRANVTAVMSNFAKTSNPLDRDKALHVLAVWAGPNEVVYLAESVKGGANEKVCKALVRMKTDQGARALAGRLGTVDNLQASVSLRDMGAVAEDAVADVLASNQNGQAKREALEILETIGTKKSVPKVEQAIQREGWMQVQGKIAIKAMQAR